MTNSTSQLYVLHPPTSTPPHPIHLGRFADGTPAARLGLGRSLAALPGHLPPAGRGADIAPKGHVEGGGIGHVERWLGREVKGLGVGVGVMEVIIF